MMFVEADIDAWRKMKGPRKKLLVLKILKYSQRGILLLLCLGFFILQTVQCIRYYYKYPTYISSELVDQWDAVFPAFTVCADGASYDDTVLRSHGIEGKNGYVGSKNEKKWTSNQPSVSP